MKILTAIIFPIIGILTSILIKTIWNHYRSSLYKNYDNAHKAKFSDGDKSAAPPSCIINKYNSLAILHQNKFHNLLSLATSLIFSSFILFSISLCWKLEQKNILFSIFASEAAFLIIALILIDRSIDAKKLWLKNRAITELIRRKYFIKSVSISDSRIGKEHDWKMLESKYVEAMKNISTKEISKLCKEDFDLIKLENSMTLHPTEEYIKKRIYRQKLWFEQATKRISKQISDREKIVKFSFFIVIFLALIKSSYYSGISIPAFEHVKPAMNMIALSAIGITILTAAIIINTASMQLLSRYETQIEQIDTLLTRELNSPQVVIKFENIMQDELSFFLKGIGNSGIEISL